MERLSIDAGDADDQVRKLADGLVKKFNPEKIILFGSRAENKNEKDSDIDICIVADFSDKREFRKLISRYIYDWEGLDFDVPVDIIVYTPEQWERLSQEKFSFANIIDKEGLVLYGR